MAKRIAQFHKVSFEQFKEGFADCFGKTDEEEIREIYEDIRLPKRATKGSAGYDFFAPVPLVIAPGKTVKVPTGVRVEMQENWVLKKRTWIQIPAAAEQYGRYYRQRLLLFR